MNKHTTIRRSVALPRDLVDEVLAVAPAGLRGNLNRVVLIALREYVKRERAAEFEGAMADMGADPAIREEIRQINEDFRATEADGLRRD